MKDPDFLKRKISLHNVNEITKKYSKLMHPKNSSLLSNHMINKSFAVKQSTRQVTN